LVASNTIIRSSHAVREVVRGRRVQFREMGFAPFLSAAASVTGEDLSFRSRSGGRWTLCPESR
jgi:hypothetical protein